jgi:hypothetical protein
MDIAHECDCGNRGGAGYEFSAGEGRDGIERHGFPPMDDAFGIFESAVAALCREVR